MFLSFCFCDDTVVVAADVAVCCVLGLGPLERRADEFRLAIESRLVEFELVMLPTLLMACWIWLAGPRARDEICAFIVSVDFGSI